MQSHRQGEGQGWRQCMVRLRSLGYCHACEAQSTAAFLQKASGSL